MVSNRFCLPFTCHTPERHLQITEDNNRTTDDDQIDGLLLDLALKVESGPVACIEVTYPTEKDDRHRPFSLIRHLRGWCEIVVSRQMIIGWAIFGSDRREIHCAQIRGSGGESIEKIPENENHQWQESAMSQSCDRTNDHEGNVDTFGVSKLR